MPLSKTAIVRLSARLQTVEHIANLILQELPALMAENAFEALTAAERQALREKFALYKALLVTARSRGTGAGTAGDLTRDQVGRLYFDAQTAMNRIGEAARKLRALGSDTLEDATITAAQKTVWQSKLTATLTQLDAAIAAFPDES